MGRQKGMVAVMIYPRAHVSKTTLAWRLTVTLSVRAPFSNLHVDGGIVPFSQNANFIVV